MTTSLESSRTPIGNRYEIERELGRGAMARVYLARDTKYDRLVAVKVLLADVGFALGPERFRREIELVTHLSHPHILPIYDSGEENGELYYVMPYVAGETLRARLNRERQLPLDEALRIATEVANALDHSHRHGIIHRDIKPENILMEDGQAMVADFGIARVVTAIGGEKLTSTGISVGTPTYMSPEQGMADPGLDARSDIYSLGCVLYEMLTGSPPFTGRTTQALIARHSLDAVPSLVTVRSTISEEIEEVVLRSLEKVPADRFATAAEFAAALTAAQGTGSYTMNRTGRRTGARKRPPQRSWRTAAIVAGVGVVLIAGGAWATKSILSGPRAASASVLGATGFRPQRIAVMYFEDRSAGGKLSYLADGLTEALIKQLDGVSALDVISTGGVKPFRAQPVADDSVARALQAGTLVEGSVESANDQVRVNLRLVDGNTGDVWDRGSVTESLNDPIALQNKMSDQLSVMLRKWLGEEVRVRNLRAGTENPRAWSLLQQAERKRKDAEALEKEGKVPEAATQLASADSLLAQAELLDNAWTEPIVLRGVLAGRQERLTEDPAAVAKWIDNGIAHANRALAVDPRQADALELRGTLRIRRIIRGLLKQQREIDAEVTAADTDLRSAIAINPNQAGALERLSAIQYQKQNRVESHNLARRAYEADTYLTAAPDILWRLYSTSYDLEEFADAEQWCDQEVKRFPAYPGSTRCRLWIMTAKSTKADPAEAWRRAADFERAAPPPQREYSKREGEIVVASVLGRAGLVDSARHVLLRARADRSIDPRGELIGWEAFVRAQLGDKEEAINLIETYLTNHPEHRLGFQKATAWWWRDLQSDPRFKTLIASGG